jgi:NTP pyrophosphatase (non-canonical NTP hydrolase)
MKDKIQAWAFARNLHTADKTKQMLKLMEEVGELSSALAKYNINGIIDSIGDIYVVLVIISLQLGLDIDDCIRSAYEEIKDRKGKLIDGIFVKENDLPKGGSNE